MIRRIAGWLIVAAVALGLAFAVLTALGGRLDRTLDPDPQTIASASLQGLRAQNRLTPFMARFVAVVTSEQRRFGLSARKTLIMPGLVRYEVDLARLQQRDLAWDAATSTLTVTLPPIELAGPEVDLTAIREYDAGGMLMALTDVETRLDAANRARGQAALVAQAREAVPMRLAQDAARTAIARSFEMPLRAAGIQARVVARFATDGVAAAEQMNRTRRPAAVYNEATGPR
jgi:hypothetical protein